ncbi:Blue copper protein [Senna tora]|uniref:Blue copper protein n=1 Tax=Senna tora TaxID=362788 RepID=A0A835CFV0_9FABA|nr:Blue copper protein [Senna tora]
MEMEIMKARTTTFVKRCRFVVGFILALLLLKLKVVVGVFKYVKGEHNAYEVTEKTFRSCDTSSGVLAMICHRKIIFLQSHRQQKTTIARTPSGSVRPPEQGLKC